MDSIEFNAFWLELVENICVCVYSLDKLCRSSLEMPPHLVNHVGLSEPHNSLFGVIT